jgi:hypothetical protein
MTDCLLSKVAVVLFVVLRKGTEASAGKNAGWQLITIMKQERFADCCAAIAIAALDAFTIQLIYLKPLCVISRGGSRGSEKADHNNNC